MNRRSFLSATVALALVAAHAGDGPGSARVGADLAYLNSISTLEGEFVQVDPDGLLSEGLFYMSRPGRIRFEYADPNPALVISDGFWVGVIDKRYGDINRYPLSETPLQLDFEGKASI